MVALIVLAFVSAVPVPGITPLAAFVLVILATRMFRGPDEPDDSPRDWWRATERPVASFVIGALFALATVVVALDVYAIATFPEERELRVDEGYVALTGLLALILAVGYLQSGVRLRRERATSK